MSKEEIVFSLLKGAAQVTSPMGGNPSMYGYTASVTKADGASTSHVGGRTDFLKEDKMSDTTVSSIASLTKMFTAATILKMMEHDDYKGAFPKGLDPHYFILFLCY
jgi:CubicO group peptidase (beta-lactamase class C family)